MSLLNKIRLFIGENLLWDHHIEKIFNTTFTWHRTVKLKLNNEIVEIDEDIVDIIKSINYAGIKTSFSCQGQVRYIQEADRAYVAMEPNEKAKNLMVDLTNQVNCGSLYGIVIDHPTFQTGADKEYIVIRWHPNFTKQLTEIIRTILKD